MLWSKFRAQSFCDHVQRLETSGLVQSSKSGRVRTVTLVPGELSLEELDALT